VNGAAGVLREFWHWGLALAVGFPLALLLLNELVGSLARRGNHLQVPLRWIRNWLLPALALVLFLTKIVGWPAENIWVRLAHTLLWILLVAGVLGIINSVVFESAPAGSWPTRVPRLLRDLIRMLLVALAAAIVYSQVWGEDLSGALTALGVSSIVVGLALQEPLGNLFSGIMLLMERPFEVGDDIEVTGVTGVVKEINWRSAHVKSLGGITRIIPNSTLNKETITNYSRPRHERMEIVEIAFCYDDPPNDVRNMLLEVAMATPGVLTDPPPITSTWEFGDFGITYRVIYRTAEADRWSARNELMTRIWYGARRAGLTMPYPVEMSVEHQANEPFGKPRPTVTQLLQRFPRIPPLTATEARSGATPLEFGKGEVIFEQGAELNGMYVVVSGLVSLQYAHESGNIDFANVEPGELFGEAGLNRSQATDRRAVAMVDTVVVRISPETVQRLFETSPQLARETGQALDVRRRALQSAKDATRKPT
jgi:small-conductance mechanosensitive channel